MRALKRLLNGGRAIGRYILVSGLSTVLKGIANDEVSEWSLTSADVASAASSRPDGVPGDTGGETKRRNETEKDSKEQTRTVKAHDNDARNRVNQGTAGSHTWHAFSLVHCAKTLSTM